MTTYSNQTAPVYRPNTLLERGVTVPFTTPSLVGARVRSSDRGDVELVIANLAGGRGAYVLPRQGIREMCRPTVHDVCLSQRVFAIHCVTPSAVRKAALAIAADGLAGRDAADNAKKAVDLEAKNALLCKSWLLDTLAGPMEPQFVSSDPSLDEAKLVEARSEHVLACIAPRLSHSPQELAISLDAIAHALAVVGVGSQSDCSRVGRLLVMLRQLQSSTVRWCNEHGDESGSQAGMIAEAAEAATSCAKHVLSEVRAFGHSILALLQRWTEAPQEMAYLTARPEWLLDGWEQLCLLWETADSDAKRRATLMEMTTLTPIIPRELSDWDIRPADVGHASHSRSNARLNEDWRTGETVLEVIARNERLRARAA